VRTDPPHGAAESAKAQEASHVALGLVVNELVAEASRYASRHPRLAVAVGGAALLAVLRVLWLGMWWLLFAPAALYPLAGRITCGGEPIQEGNIALEPVGSTGVASRAALTSRGNAQRRVGSCANRCSMPRFVDGRRIRLYTDHACIDGFDDRPVLPRDDHS
jgi:hypothetical protein